MWAATRWAAPRSFSDAAAKYVRGIVRGFGVERISFRIEPLQLLGLVEAVFYRVARHQTTSPLRMKAEDLVAAALPVLEHGRDVRCFKQLRLDRLEKHTRRTKHQHTRKSSALFQ